MELMGIEPLGIGLSGIGPVSIGLQGIGLQGCSREHMPTLTVAPHERGNVSVFDRKDGF